MSGDRISTGDAARMEYCEPCAEAISVPADAPRCWNCAAEGEPLAEHSCAVHDRVKLCPKCYEAPPCAS